MTLRSKKLKTSITIKYDAGELMSYTLPDCFFMALDVDYLEIAPVLQSYYGPNILPITRK